ncbi:MFS transporter [Bradyrhizobium sp. 41S5]|uniref:MFS transporter n=1 Tax=Bradyrhizobium sp. 41S5 TaxID=1404443 RepID=UPI00156B386F|nr:MFS transporter [Bradyrhizobium sp. 41S5]UFX44133.1 MFS transporter [Bradyrhizobium sp. 41S5]
MTAQVLSGRARTIRRISVGLLVLSGIVNFMDRFALSVANPLIRQDLGLSISSMGILLSAFLWAYALAQLPVGALVDRYGPRRLLAVGIVIWSLAQAAGGVVSNLGQFFASRFMLGVGEAPQFTVGVRVVRDWFHFRERGLPTGIFLCSTALGTAISAPVLTWLMLSFGWRAMFLIMGVAGVVLAMLWSAIYRNPADVGLPASDHAYLQDGNTAADNHKVRFSEWRELFALRNTWGMIAGYFGLLYLLWIYNAWLPSYFEIERHMSIARTGIVSAFPFIFGVGGSVLGGWIPDRLVAMGISPMNSRKFPFVLALATFAILTLVATQVENDAVSVAVLSIASLFGFVANGSAWAMASVAAPHNRVASLASMQNFGGYIGAALAPTITGFIVEEAGSFNPALFVGVTIGLASSLIYLVTVRDDATERSLIKDEQPLGSLR